MDKLKLKKKVFPLFILLVLFLIYFIPIKAQLLLAPRMVIIPNYNGLNTRFEVQNYLNFDNISLINASIFVNDNYMINVTSGSNAIIKVKHLFDNYGIILTPTKLITLNLNVSDKGEPSFIYGNKSYNYNPGTKSLSLNASSDLYIFWDSYGSCYLYDPDFNGFVHSWGNYKTCYGFGIWIGDEPPYAGPHRQNLFHVDVYCKNGLNDINWVDLKIGNDIHLRFNYETTLFSEISDPNNYWDFRTGHRNWAYDSSKKILTVNFIGVFLDYQPRMVNQNTTVIVNSDTDGTLTNLEYNTFFIAQTEVHPVIAVPPIWDRYLMTFFGLGGLVMLVYSPYYAAKKIKEGKWDDALFNLIVFLIIGFGLVVSWLWG